ncbi:MAG: electron transport complex subunit RsxD [Pseudomonadota bacterium]
MRFSTAISPHLKPRRDVTVVMLQVLLALIPGAAAMVWFFGMGVLINLSLAVVTALVLEALVLMLRGKPLKPYLTDLSAVVTAVLLALALPALAPWWITVVGICFAVIIAKHLYGGLGYNPFNPAMAGYVLLLVSFPKQMTTWMPPEDLIAVALGFEDVLRLMFLEQLPENVTVDGVTMATPLDAVKTGVGLDKSIADIRAGAVFGLIAGKGWEWAAGGYLIGGFWLVSRRIVAWQIPTGFLGGLLVISLAFFLLDPGRFSSPLFHLFGGATMLGAFFIATDPVTASTTPAGRLIYGALAGVLVYIIRTWGGYPDGVAFAVLLMNLAAPTLDYYTRPRVFGRS